MLRAAVLQGKIAAIYTRHGGKVKFIAGTLVYLMTV